MVYDQFRTITRPLMMYNNQVSVKALWLLHGSNSFPCCKDLSKGERRYFQIIVGIDPVVEYIFLQRAIYYRCQKTPLDTTCNYIRWDENKCEHVMDRTRWKVKRQALLWLFCSFYRFREYFDHFLDLEGILIIFKFWDIVVIF